MITGADIQPGDILYEDISPRRSILVVHIQPCKSRSFPEWEYSVWWLPRTTSSGRWDELNRGNPTGPFSFGGSIGWHKKEE